MTIAPKGYPPPSKNQYQQKMFDSPGVWRFFGTMRQTVGSEVIKVLISEPLPFAVIQTQSGLEVTEPIQGTVYNDVEWLGWWIKQDDN